MNYDHVNLYGDYLLKHVYPNIRNVFTAMSFEEFCKRYSYLKSGKWLMQDNLEAAGLQFAYNTIELLRKFKDKCVCYVIPADPNEGALHITYQLTPKFLLKGRVYMWIEHSEIQTYMRLSGLTTDMNNIFELQSELSSLRLTGNTEESKSTGFKSLIGQ